MLTKWPNTELFAKKYEHDISLFGTVSVTPPPRQMQELKQQEIAVYDVQSKQENNLISRGHNRILEKVEFTSRSFESCSGRKKWMW